MESPADGLAEGRRIGSKVGKLDGLKVGSREGEVVFLVGAGVGWDEGFLEGLFCNGEKVG